MYLAELLKDSAYKLTQFKPAQIAALEAGISQKEGGKALYVQCLVRGKSIRLSAEEAVRQLYVMVLRDDLGYPVNRMELEYGVTFGTEKKRADICIFDKDRPTTPYVLVELKKPKLKDGKEQLKSYCNATGAPMGVWSNGEQISFYHRKDPNYFEDIPAIPSAHEKLSDVLSERWTIDDLIKKDKLVNEKKSLKDLILEMEDEVLANAGVDVFEELFKLIFTKLFDELEGGRDRKRHLIFKNYGDTETELKVKIQHLFDKACDKWPGVFPDGAKIDLTPSHLAVCVGTIGRAAPYLHASNALPDNHVTVLRTDALSPICLALYLNSIAGQYQVEQHFKGSSGQIELYPADIANFWCPEVDASVQRKIDALAQQSFTLKARSKQLLEAAKRAVEIAIEQDEAAGMAYLAQQEA